MVAGPDRRTQARPVRTYRTEPGVRRTRLARTVVLTVLVLGGTGVAWAAWPEAEPPLVTHKEHPPEPVNLTGPADRCTADVLDLTLAADRTTFGPGQPVTFHLAVTNAGRVPCLVDGSDGSWAVTVTSGEDRVWSSADCSAEERMLLLGPDDVYRREVRWSDVRSAPGCAEGQPDLAAGTYTARAALGDVADATSPEVAVTRTEPSPPPSPEAGASPTATPDAGASPTATPDAGAASGAPAG